MTDKEFSLRLAKLRTQKGVSARDMSLSMGQNPGHINNIETGKSMPSLSGFFYICDYLDITARDFFDDGNEYPEQLRAVFQDMQKKVLTAQTEEISRTVLELERKISGSDDGSNAVIEHFKSYAGITALTKEISADLLQSVTIYPDGRMHIRLNLADEIEALMETLRRESCTAQIY